MPKKKRTRSATTRKAASRKRAAPKEARRTPKEKKKAAVPEGLPKNLSVERIALEQIDIDDRSLQMRAVFRTSDLEKSIAEHGQQIPVVLRPRGKRYQIVSGFRRITALHKLGIPTVHAYVRKDLKDDEEAFRASVLENIARKSYNDLDRALVIRRHREQGYKSFEAASLMRLSKRQANNLLSLLDLPKTVQDALTDEGSPFKATHALMLKKLKGRYPGLDYGVWIKRVNAEELSVAQLVRRVNAEYVGKEKPTTLSIFRSDATRAKDGVFRLQPIKLNVKELADEDRGRLREELTTLLRALEP